ncbi:hypothetical protein FXO37_00547 [Capsicum annuum]|uniref:uncharacterized protein LOC124897626 n=1 Tax=Capsicum annuum TaxID=4072 RepID=UPI001FB0FBE3|nr:uncharacterized protein LOC124897626 [Capsicum annuum]KAF3685488.1 hypothetical protein FXO37_00547 [Capsicum annuum]
MGCFLSSTKKTPPNSNTKLETTTINRYPPITLSFLEEQKEEVKEILSETPIIINNNPIIHRTNEKNNIPKKDLSPEEKQCQNNIHDSHVYKIARIFNPRELGVIRAGPGSEEPVKELDRSIWAGPGQNETSKELSRHIRSGSGRIEMKGELSKSIRAGSDPKERTRQRSPAKYRNTSPAGRPGQLSGSGQTRNASPTRKSGQLSGSGQARIISPSRKDSGENSCRRSRSPIMCGDQINGGTKSSISRCSSMRKSGKSLGRVRSELGDWRRSTAPEPRNGSRSNRENRENNNYRKPLPSGINDSIENPLVSLECFIFI